jgi:ABC-type uncharacterized transport system ATPase subunit
MITVRCKECNTEINSNNKTQVCGCSNMMSVKGDKVSAQDLSKVVMIDNSSSQKNKPVLSNQDLAFQEERKKRKVRKLNFEVR